MHLNKQGVMDFLPISEYRALQHTRQNMINTWITGSTFEQKYNCFNPEHDCITFSTYRQGYCIKKKPDLKCSYSILNVHNQEHWCDIYAIDGLNMIEIENRPRPKLHKQEKDLDMKVLFFTSNSFARTTKCSMRTAWFTVPNIVVRSTVNIIK